MTAPNVLLTVQGVDMCAFTIADVRITVGRRTVYEQPEAGTMNARMVTAAVGGPDGTVLPGSRVEVWMSTAPGGTAPWDGAAVLWSDTATTWDGASWAAPDWRLFAGRITDVSAVPDADGWLLNVTAAGPLAELARTPIGDEPWPAETDSARIHRVLSLAGYDTSGVDPAWHGPLILPRDVDRQPALAVMADAATSGSGLLWEDHDADVIRYQPQIFRGGDSGAAWDTIGGTWDERTRPWDSADPVPEAPWMVDGCDVLLTPWTYTAQVGQLVTWCEVRYGDPEQRAESGSRTPPVYGRTIATSLAQSGAAQELADRTVYVRSAPRWDAPTATLSVSDMPLADWAALPANVTGGRLVELQPLPAGSPYLRLLGFLEGWTHLLSDSGTGLEWSIELAVSEFALTARSTTWDTSTPLTWDTVAPDDTWNTPRLQGAEG